MRHVTLSLFLCAGVAACTSQQPPDDRVDGPAVDIALAALNLQGVGDVVWDLAVENGASTPETVWERRITSSGYGDSAGSASYVAPCDADANDNTVKVWVVGVYADDVADPGEFNAGSTAGIGAVTGTSIPFQNPTTAAPLTQTVTCEENADAHVQFDVALMRPAQQGFFDVAVNFNNIFCSAKLDCCADDDGTAGCATDGSEDIDLLFDASGARSRTIVIGFACTAGPSADVTTALYMDDLTLDCTSPNDGANFAADITVSPDASSPGNLCTAGADGMSTCAAITETGGVDADTYLFQVGMYRGAEQLYTGGDAKKVYWNLALGVTEDIGDCALRLRATADDADNTDDNVDGGTIGAGTSYPFVSWSADLATCAEEPLTFDDPAANVRTAYTDLAAGATSFAHVYAPSLPCFTDNGGCDVNATCTNAGTTAVCTCNTGWDGDGETCDNVDECLTDNGGCDANATCEDTVGSFTCTCQSGYTGDGFTCDPDPTYPDPFSFSPVTDAYPGSDRSSDTVALSGFAGPVPIVFSGNTTDAAWSVDGGSNWNTDLVGQTVSPTADFRLRQRVGQAGETTTLTVTVGGGDPVDFVVTARLTYQQPGTFTFVVPDGVTSLDVVVVGAGGAGNNCGSVPNGGSSSFGSIIAYGGTGASGTSPGSGGGASGGDVNYTGGNGGAAGADPGNLRGSGGGGGGGAGGGGGGGAGGNAGSNGVPAPDGNVGQGGTGGGGNTSGQAGPAGAFAINYSSRVPGGAGGNDGVDDAGDGGWSGYSGASNGVGGSGGGGGGGGGPYGFNSNGSSGGPGTNGSASSGGRGGIGGGGGGFGLWQNAGIGGGGGGGYARKTLSVTPGQSFTVVVGLGGGNSGDFCSSYYQGTGGDGAVKIAY